MAIDPTAALKVLGYDADAFEDDEAFRLQFEKDWLKASDAPMNKDVQKHVFGRINGAMRTAIKQSARDLEVEGDWESLDPIDGIKALASETAKRLSAMKAAQEGGTAPAKEVAEAKRQYDEAKRKLDDLTKLYDESTKKYSDLEQSIAKEKEEAKINGIYGSAIGKLKLRKMTSFERDGFEAAVRRDYSLKFDDEGNPYVVGKDGERIRDAKKAHGYLSIDEALQAYAEANDLIEKEAPAPVQRRTIPLTDGGGTTTPPRNQEGERIVRPVATRV